MVSGGINGILQKAWLRKAQIVQVLQAQVVIFLVAPLFAVPFLVSSTVTGVYSVRKGIENKKFWREYRHNTHRSPRYPYRVGYYDYVRDFGTSAMASGFAFKNLKKFR